MVIRYALMSHSHQLRSWSPGPTRVCENWQSCDRAGAFWPFGGWDLVATTVCYQQCVIISKVTLLAYPVALIFVESVSGTHVSYDPSIWPRLLEQELLVIHVAVSDKCTVFEQASTMWMHWGISYGALPGRALRHFLF